MRQGCFAPKEKYKLGLALNYIKDCGNYARRYNAAEIPDAVLNVDNLAYTGDNLYCIVADAIGFIQTLTPAPIPFAIRPGVKR